jgi:ubiquinone/menaquinone biosynthesis C-methylase UbiE
MPEPQIRFEDGAGYERMMGTWSRLAGDIFLDWLAPPPGLRWIDIGCGNGAFTERLVERTAPAEVQGIDPSEAQLAFARTRPAGRVAEFRQGDAMALPFPAARFDAATMALVIFFVPDPVKGMAEMARVLAPGGVAGAYAWDIMGGGFPLEAIQAGVRDMGLQPVLPPSVSASRIEAMRELWAGAGFEEIETREIAVTRGFADFEDYWATALLGSSARARIETMSPDEVAELKRRVNARLPAAAAGRITLPARANAIKGRKPR